MVNQFGAEDSVGVPPTDATGTVALPMKSLMIGAKNTCQKFAWRAGGALLSNCRSLNITLSDKTNNMKLLSKICVGLLAALALSASAVNAQTNSSSADTNAAAATPKPRLKTDRKSTRLNSSH